MLQLCVCVCVCVCVGVCVCVYGSGPGGGDCIEEESRQLRPMTLVCMGIGCRAEEGFDPRPDPLG